MKELSVVQSGLPDSLQDLARFVLIGRDKLQAVRAEISAIQKLGLAKEVYEQKKQEAQEIAETVTLAEMRTGELLKAIPKATKDNARKQISPGVDLIKPKAETIRDLGFTQKQAERMQTMADNPQIVKQAIQEARDNDDIVSRAFVLGKIKQAKKDEKKADIQKRIEEYAEVQTGAIDIQAPQKKYNIIYADPPWKHDAWINGDKAPNLHYKTMETADICKLPVSTLSDNDCVLFLWATFPHIQDALDVIKAWGFKYSTAAFVWVKKNKGKDTPFFGCGAWTRANSEVCLLATKGTIQRLDASISQIVESPIEEHSKKPDVVRELIERLVGKLPRVELFCRHPAEGWDVWGNEA